MTRKIRQFAFALSGTASAVLFWGYFVQHFKWRDCFNELGRCFDAESGVVYHAQSGGIWLSLAVLAAGIALYQLWRLRR
ncbi:hypothetical protein K3X41_13255 [Aliiroseovarius crassostreae]|uniref:hypothetical protein n=1 Tax=Aliiroseovarius crassostreae TaxID=154981 RepID=UPI00220A498B|nr:hypothetical protein [Aliiroseovarius crassostreae]UWQ07713.1 hypothetical protein K3X25_13375 [Aliiroseovarius crassostreae]UWQ10818.1 hypothetical protein K3X41_13255 [Aliiroseovarius crassostreae]